MKKKIALILIIIFFICFLIVLYFIHRKEENILKKDIKLEINSEVKLSDLKFEDIEFIQDKIIDTSKLGVLEIPIVYKEKNKDKEGILEVVVQDTTPPVIEYNKEIKVLVGKKIDLLDGVKVRDNSKEDIKINIKGEYDLDKVGTYELFYVAEDSSKNKCEEKFTLKVTKEEKYPKLVEPTGEKIDVLTTSNGYKMYTINGSYYIDGYLIVNKSYTLGDGFEPVNTHVNAVGVRKECNECINNVAYDAFSDMQSDAKALGLNIKITSGYRPYNIQSIIYNNYIRRDGKEKADTYSARPGHSEHQTGIAFDLNSITDAFQYTDEGKWVNDNCYLYGFIIRYPKNKQDITGFKYESWHLRYVGSELASILYNNGDWITLEEYFGIDSKYNN